MTTKDKALKEYLKKLLGLSLNERNRDEWVHRQLAAIPAGALLLDAGCGTQRYRPFCAHLEYRAQDFGRYDGTGTGKGLQSGSWNYGKLDYEGNIWEINEKDAAFDAILCTEVLEHLPCPEHALREFDRLLKPGGILILSAPFCSIPHMQPYYFYSGFSQEFYHEFLGQFGFDPVEITVNGNAFDFCVQELLRLRDCMSLPVRALYTMAITPPLALLRLLSLKYGSAAHYLCFGLHVRAKKC